MASPRYAPAGARLNLSLTRTVIGGVVLATAVLLALPAVTRSGSDRLSAATGQQASVASAASSTAVATPSPAASGQLAAIDIHPSKIGSALPAAPVAAGLFGPAGQSGELGIPTMVLKAYHLAADKLAVQQPSCKLPWWLLAGIGHTESGHAESGRLYADGTTRGVILGPRLNGGIAGDAVISDTDHGKYDGDTVYDRAVGPMQFIPSTWAKWGVDGNGDGKADPSNIFDATLAAGHYLCADGRDLSTPAGLAAAVLSYNHSQPYLATVLAWGLAYRNGALALADSPFPVNPDVTQVRPPITSRPPAGATKSSSPAGHPTTSPTGSHPTSSSSVPAPTCTSTAAPSSTAVSSPAGSSTAAGAGSASGSTQAASVQNSADGGSATAASQTGTSQTGTSQTGTSQAGASKSAAGQGGTSSASSTGTVSASPTGCAGK